MFTEISWSPFSYEFTAGKPFPFNLKIFPLCVPGGIFILALPSNPGRRGRPRHSADRGGCHVVVVADRDSQRLAPVAAPIRIGLDSWMR